MKRSTETLSLVLIGSVIAMGGCRSRNDDEERNGGGRMGGASAFMLGRAMSGSRGVGGSTPSVSSRGGFGGSGAASVAG